MKDPKHTLTLHCQLGCGRVVGTAKTRQPTTEDEYRSRMKICDQRCTECQEEHGTFRELTRQFEREARATPAEATAFVVKHRKRTDFIRELAKERTRRGLDIINE